MGQSYILINKKKREFVHPHELGNGYKFLEFFESHTATALAYLLLKLNGDADDPPHGPMAGRWAGDVVVVLGEYERTDLYHRAQASFTNISSKVAEDLRKLGVRVPSTLFGRNNPSAGGVSDV